MLFVPLSQLGPLYPDRQLHSYEPDNSTQRAPFLHGLLSHSRTSETTNHTCVYEHICICYSKSISIYLC